MVGIIIISHAGLAEALVDSAGMLVGKAEQLTWEGIYPEDTPEGFYERVLKSAKQVDTGDGIVALADLYGGTPNNTIFKLSREMNVRIITGVNLPMVMYAIAERLPETTQQELVEGLIAAGIEGIEEFGF
jgi:PTS system mannose-specific IIA component